MFAATAAFSRASRSPPARAALRATQSIPTRRCERTVNTGNRKYAFRTLLETPGFTAIAVATIALGIAANTAIFSVVNAVLLRPLPFRDESRVVMIYTSTADEPKSNHSARDFLDMEAGNRTFEAMAGFRGDVASVATKPGEPQQTQAAWVTAPFFDVLGQPAALGRTFTKRRTACQATAGGDWPRDGKLAAIGCHRAGGSVSTARRGDGPSCRADAA